MAAVIETHALSRRYGKQLAVDSLDMQVRSGEIYGFLGLNGAGKTTTIRMILGLIRATSGEISVLGREVPKQRMKVMGHVGSLVESPSYYAHLTGRENLRILTTLLGAKESRIEEVLRVVGLASAASKKAGQYSLGMKQRLGIAAALLNEPQVLVLDEPTNGLDPAGIQEIRELLVSMPSEYGITVLVSSHLLSEVDQMATHVGVIHEGRMLFQGPIEDLRERSAPAVAIKVDRVEDAELALTGTGLMVAAEPDSVLLSTMDTEDAAHAVRTLVGEDIAVYRVEERRPALEDIFLDLTNGGAV